MHKRMTISIDETVYEGAHAALRQRPCPTKNKPRHLDEVTGPVSDLRLRTRYAAVLPLSKNCSSSVECDSAVVDALLPCTVVVTASK